MPNEPQTQLEQWAEEYDTDVQFRAEGLATETITQVIDKLTALGKSRSWLASVLNVRRQQVSHMLNAPPNLTLTSIARLAIALDTKPRIIFDSDSYLVRSIYESYRIEDIDLELQERRYQTMDTQATSNPVTKEKVLDAAR